MRPGRDTLLGWFLLAAAGLFALRLFAGQWAIDLTALYFAAHFFSSGNPDLVYLPGAEVFAYDPPPEWTAYEVEQGMPGGHLTPFLYPPLWAALLSPLAERVSAQGFFDGFLALNVAALAAMVWLAFRLAGRPAMGFAAWALLSVALIGTSVVGIMGLWLGQPQILVSALTLAAFALLAARHDLGAGALLALAAAMKLTPALFAVVLVMERRWRALAAFAAVGAGLALASVALAGWPLHAAFLGKLREVEAQVLVSRIVASLELALYQLQALHAGTAFWTFDTPHTLPEPGWIGWVVRLALGLGLAAAWATTRGLAARPRLWARLMAVALVALVTGPLGWIHYLVMPLALLPGLVLFWPLRRMLLAVAATGAALSMPVFLFFAHHPALAFPHAGLHLAVALGLLGLVLGAAAGAARGR